MDDTTNHKIIITRGEEIETYYYDSYRDLYLDLQNFLESKFDKIQIFESDRMIEEFG